MKKSFIEIIDPEKAEGTLKRAYRRIGGSRGAIAHVHQSQSLHPKAMLGHLDLYMSIMYDKDSPLSRSQRELIGTLVSVLNNCDYCIVHHYEALLEHWKEAPEPKLLMKGEKMNEQDIALKDHVTKLVNQPWNIVESDILMLRDNGFNDRAILDITLITGYFCFVNRLTLGLGVHLEDEHERNYNY